MKFIRSDFDDLLYPLYTDHQHKTYYLTDNVDLLDFALTHNLESVEAYRVYEELGHSSAFMISGYEKLHYTKKPESLTISYRKFESLPVLYMKYLD